VTEAEAPHRSLTSTDHALSRRRYTQQAGKSCCETTGLFPTLKWAEGRHAQTNSKCSLFKQIRIGSTTDTTT
jgi:hypothetical protein